MMCNSACVAFGKKALLESEVRGRDLIEVGSLDVNGSLRSVAEFLQPASYVGVDLQAGPGVDEICDAGQLVARFGEGSFDVLISTELLEHVRDWRKVVHNFKRLLRPGGVAILTTRSQGFPYHGFPYDFWRFEAEDMLRIFADFGIELLESDPSSPGVFLKARRPAHLVEEDLSSHSLFSIIAGRQVLRIRNHQIIWYGIKHPIPSLVYLRNTLYHQLGSAQ